MHQRKNQETEIVQTVGVPERAEKRQRPAREHVEREGSTRSGGLCVWTSCSGRSLANAGPCEPRLYQKELLDEMLQKSLNSRVKRAFKFKPFQRRRLKTLSAMPFTKDLLPSIAAYEYADLEDVFKKAEEKGEDPFIVILDGVEDPHNLGSILRTADATGVHGIIIPKRRSASLTATVAKASTGAIEHVPVVRVTNLTQTIEQLKARGIWVFGTDMNGTDYRKWNTSGPSCDCDGERRKRCLSYREGKRG